MTFIEIEEAPNEFDQELAGLAGRTIKCSWCGQLICLDGHELALAMCQACYKKMLDEFLRAQQSTANAQLPA